MNCHQQHSIFKFNKKGLTIIGLFLILWLAFHVRSSWVLYNVFNPDIGYDGLRYQWIAKNLIDHKGFGYYPNQPSSWRPPGYPFLLYGIYSLLGHSIHLVRLVQAWIGTAICFIIFLLTRKCCRDMAFPNSIALLAAFLYAVNFYSVFVNQILYSELFNSFLILLSIYLFILANEAENRKFYILASLASLTLWYAVLTRPANILFWLWVGSWFLIQNRNDLKRIPKAILIVLFFFAVTVLPWTIRNYHLHKKFLLISSNGGFIFHMAHHPYSEGGFIPEGPTRYTPEQLDQLNGLSEVDRQNKNFQFGLEWIKKNPRRELELIFLKQKRLWTNIENINIFYDTLPHWPFPLLTFHFFLIFALPGLYFASRHIKYFTLPLLYILNHSLVISFIYLYQGSRMRAALLPLLAIFAAIGIIYLGARLFQIMAKRNPLRISA